MPGIGEGAPLRKKQLGDDKTVLGELAAQLHGGGEGGLQRWSESCKSSRLPCCGNGLRGMALRASHCGTASFRWKSLKDLYAAAALCLPALPECGRLEGRGGGGRAREELT